MARICMTSDLHLGITRETTIREVVEGIRLLEPDLTVLAGDLGEPLSLFTWCLDLFADLPGTVAVLAGNHDLWARAEAHSQQLWEHALPDAVRDRGMLWLEDATWRHDEVACVGSIAWYDYSAADPSFSQRPPEYFAANKQMYNNDATYLDWPWTDQDFATRVGEGLVARLMAAEGDPQVRDILVVTHVPLCEQQMRRKPNDPQWGFTNAYFGNLTLGKHVLAASKVRAIVSGHTHVKRQELVSRPGQRDVFTSVLGADYRAPAFEVIDTSTHPAFATR